MPRLGLGIGAFMKVPSPLDISSLAGWYSSEANYLTKDGADAVSVMLDRKNGLATDGTEIANNGDLETGDTTSWGSSFQNGAAGSKSAATDDKHSGSYSLKVNITNEGLAVSDIQAWNVIDDLTVNDVYRLSFWVKSDFTPTATANIKVIKNSSPYTAAGLNESFTPSTTWTNYTYNFVCTNAFASDMRANFYFGNLGTGNIWIDDVTIQKVQGNHGFQTTGANQPAWATGSPPTITYDGGDSLEITDFAHALDGLTIFAVAKNTNVGATKALFSHYDIGANQRSFDLRKTAGEAYQITISSNGTATTSAGAGTIGTTDTEIWTGVFTASTSLKLYINGGLKANNTTSIPASIHNSTANLSIGSHLNNGAIANGWNGDINEVVWYDKTLSNGELNRIGRYLATKHGLSWTNI